jgi:hypothetical protein
MLAYCSDESFPRSITAYAKLKKALAVEPRNKSAAELPRFAPKQVLPYLLLQSILFGSRMPAAVQPLEERLVFLAGPVGMDPAPLFFISSRLRMLIICIDVDSGYIEIMV